MIVKARKQQKCAQRADKAGRHIFLRVPRIALGSQEIVGCGPGCHRHSPLEQFVHRADRHADAQHDHEHPSTSFDNVLTRENFSCNERGNESLGEVTDAIVIIPRKMKVVPNPAEDRLTCIGEMTTDNQYQCMQENRSVEQLRQREPFVCEQQNRQRNQRRNHFQEPSEVIIRTDADQASATKNAPSNVNAYRAIDRLTGYSSLVGGMVFALSSAPR